MTTKTLELNNIEQEIFWALTALIGLVAVSYLYSVLMLTFAVVDRNSMNIAVHKLSNQAGELESEYLTQTNSVTLAYAQNLGFHEVNAKFTGDTNTDTIAKISMAR